MGEKIQKRISASGLMSRRAAEQAILSGRVMLNGRTAQIGDRAEAADAILVDGNPLPEQEEKVYILLHKPRGYVTTVHDEKGRRNVTELVKLPGVRLYPVGRLDMDSEGLLLMTNDGDFANRIMHPAHEVDKTYRVWVEGENLVQAAEALSQSMEIDGYRIRPAEVSLRQLTAGGGVLEITIHEGRNRQVRRMCAQAGLRVTRLVRIAEGGVKLGQLKSGAWRHLSTEERSLLTDAQE